MEDPVVKAEIDENGKLAEVRDAKSEEELEERRMLLRHAAFNAQECVDFVIKQVVDTDDFRDLFIYIMVCVNANYVEIGKPVSELIDEAMIKWAKDNM